MGSHAKPRTTGRKTALGALALGATLTGVGLTAAALDPATAVLTATGTDGGGATQLSGLSTPVGADLSPAADDIGTLSSAPFGNVNGLTNAAAGAPGGSASTGSSQAAGAATETGVQPIGAGAPGSGGSSTSSGSSAPSGSAGSTGTSAPSGSSSGGGYTGRHAKPGPAAPPAAVTPLAGQVTSGAGSAAASILPLAQNLVSKVPVVSSLVQGTGAAGGADAAPSTADGSGTGAGNGAGNAAGGGALAPATSALGGLPLVGTLLGGVL